MTEFFLGVKNMDILHIPVNTFSRTMPFVETHGCASPG